MNNEQIIDLLSTYRSSKKTMDMVNDIFTQGDVRYSDPEYEAIVAGFIDADAIKIEKKTLEKVQVNTSNIRGPQKEMKAVGVDLLNKLGYEVVSIERGFKGVIPDVMARKGDSIVALECGPCGIRKVINYLENDNTFLWIIRPDKDKYILFIVSKSVSWDTYLRFHDNFQSKRVKEHIERAFKDFGRET